MNEEEELSPSQRLFRHQLRSRPIRYDWVSPVGKFYVTIIGLNRWQLSILTGSEDGKRLSPKGDGFQDQNA